MRCVIGGTIKIVVVFPSFARLLEPNKGVVIEIGFAAIQSGFSPLFPGGD